MDLRPWRALTQASGRFEAPKEHIAVNHFGIAGPKTHDDIDDGHARQTGAAEHGARPLEELRLVGGHAVHDVVLVIHDEHGRMVAVDGPEICHASPPSCSAFCLAHPRCVWSFQLTSCHFPCSYSHTLRAVFCRTRKRWMRSNHSGLTSSPAIMQPISIHKKVPYVTTSTVLSRRATRWSKALSARCLRSKKFSSSECLTRAFVQCSATNRIISSASGVSLLWPRTLVGRRIS